LFLHARASTSSATSMEKVGEVGWGGMWIG
jgi:hypothetical protein